MFNYPKPDNGTKLETYVKVKVNSTKLVRANSLK